MPRRLALACTALTLALATLAAAHAGAASAAALRCHGLAVTVPAHRGTVIGTAGPDVIRLTGPGTVRAGAGDDIVCGSPWADGISAGRGADIVLGGAGADAIDGGPGADHLYGEAGADRIAGGPARDVIVTGAGKGTVAGAPGDAVSTDTYAVSVAFPRGGGAFARDDDLLCVALNPRGTWSGIVWMQFTANPANGLSWSPTDQSVYVGTTSAPGPGLSIIDITGSAPAAPGSAWTLSDGTRLQAASGGAPGTVTVTNQNPGTALIGLASPATVDGLVSRAAAPFTSAQAAPGSATALTEPFVVAVFGLPVALDGQLVKGIPADTGRAPAPSAAAPTTTFVYDTLVGRFVS